MSHKQKILLSLSAALAALTGVSSDKAEAKATNTIDQNGIASDMMNSAKPAPNAAIQVGEDLLGFVMTKQADGTIVAGHSSHVSHASHASHVSSR
ncbi:His-Xaa-Ser repeat protein HxsA2 [Afipia sp. Root123D2]|uniref:His-Xaa-Ser repeat protein HxsA2 n=1 Tax=Afipia sp. Root123D2 TaxID=1736436 RepID=UPI000A689279|nr:His-Xaa-Ser repeat protein HxsA2 [Afipia sp. Root123D2]